MTSTVFVGTYTQRLPHVNGRGTGIYVFSFEGGVLRPLGAFRGLPNPSFLAVDAQRHCVYAVSELLEFEGSPQGAIQAWSWDSEQHVLQPTGHIGSQGGAPCYISITDDHVLVANYVGGSVISVNRSETGELGSIDRVVQHAGSGPNLPRQKAPHPHAIVPDPTGTYGLVADLGTDEVSIYHLRQPQGTLTPKGNAVKIPSGSGPRHLSFHPSGNFLYVMNELTSSITLLSWKEGVSEVLETFDALPIDYTGNRAAADIHVHPSGHFLYASLRGPSSIVCFKIDTETGYLKDPVWFSTYGRLPRNFALDTNGEYLMVAHQNSDTLIVFKIDQETGHLTGPYQIINVPSPVCVKIV